MGQQNSNPDVELTERQFKVLDMIITHTPDTQVGVQQEYNNEFRKSLSYSQVRTTIKNLKNKGMLICLELPSGPARNAWDAIITLKFSGDNHNVEHIEEQRDSYKIWF